MIRPSRLISMNSTVSNHQMNKIDITVLIATKNETVNIRRCIDSLSPAERVVVLDSHSTDNTSQIAAQLGAEVVQFNHQGGYPKKRQWALETLNITTPWVFLLDADEVIPEELWDEISHAINSSQPYNAYLISKGFHFLGRRFRFGGFSHSAVLLFRYGKARFERLIEVKGDSFDMEVHERVIVDGQVGKMKTQLIHEDFKGLEAYLDRHNHYSTWEAGIRYSLLTTGEYAQDGITPRMFGNSQEWRRFIKPLIIRLPFEPQLWFIYHYIFKLGFLEGWPGLIASQIRASYIRDVRAKVYEQRARNYHGPLNEPEKKNTG